MGGSIGSLSWAFAVLFIMEMTLAIGMNRLMLQYRDENFDAETLDEIWDKFGTFSRSLLTCFAMAFGEWHETSLLLVKHVSMWLWIPVLIHQFVVGFAVFAI